MELTNTHTNTLWPSGCAAEAMTSRDPIPAPPHGLSVCGPIETREAGVREGQEEGLVIRIWEVGGGTTGGVSISLTLCSVPGSQTAAPGGNRGRPCMCL